MPDVRVVLADHLVTGKYRTLPDELQRSPSSSFMTVIPPRSIHSALRLGRSTSETVSDGTPYGRNQPVDRSGGILAVRRSQRRDVCNAACRTGENVDLERPAEKIRPREMPRPVGATRHVKSRALQGDEETLPVSTSRSPPQPGLGTTLVDYAPML